MGKITGFEPSSPFKAGVGTINDTTWTQTEKDHLSDLSFKIAKGDSFSTGDTSIALELFSKGVSNPATLPDAVALLMNPQSSGLLKEVLETTWIPDLDIKLKEDLVNIAKEPDEKNMIAKLGTKVAQELQKNSPTADTNQHPGNIPLTAAGGAFSFLLGTLGLRGKGSGEIIEEIDASQPARSDSSLANIMNSFNSGNEEQLEEALAAAAPGLKTMLGNAGPAAWPLLINLTNNPLYSGIAVELLHQQGEKIIPVLEDAAAQDSQDQQIMEYIRTGEWPQFSMADDIQISQSLQSGNLGPFKYLIQHTPDSQRLLNQVTAKGDQMIPHLIKLMGDPDGKIRAFSMDALNRLGDEAVVELRIAKADSNPEISKNAGILLKYHFEGKLAPETGLEEKANPFQKNLFDSAADNTGKNAKGSSIFFTPDIDYLKNQLSNPATCMETLNSLIQVGRPAIPVLCRLLQNSRRK